MGTGGTPGMWSPGKGWAKILRFQLLLRFQPRSRTRESLAKVQREMRGGKINAQNLGLHKTGKVISTSKLNGLPHLHLWPINRVVYPDLAPSCEGL